MHTEDAAKQLWCCMGITTQNNHGCIASKCMQWRWSTVVIRDNERCNTFEEKYDNNNKVVGSNRYEIIEKHGYCGLSGKP